MRRSEAGTKFCIPNKLPGVAAGPRIHLEIECTQESPKVLLQASHIKHCTSRAWAISSQGVPGVQTEFSFILVGVLKCTWGLFSSGMIAHTDMAVMVVKEEGKLTHP